MFEIRVEADFAAAHYLTNYHGKCENLHGHNYKIFAHARGSELDAGGMLCDFSILKNALRKVLEELDHTNLNDHEAFSEGDPSAERIAAFIFNQIEGAHPEIPLYRVDVFETDRSRASYIKD